MFILETLNFVVDILKVPSVLVGLIALIGLVAQKKAFSDVVKGTIKTILGFIVLGGGATVLVGSLNPLGGMFEHAFNIQGIIPNNEAIVSIALEKYGASTALIMAFGMVANIVVARFTRLKYIFLTGHHTFYMACMIGVILTVAGFEGVGLVFTGSLILGLVMAFFPALAQRYMRRITGTDDIAFGHFGTLGYVLSGWIGSLCGKGSRSTEEMNLPKNLSFLRDSSISISLTMMIIYLIMAVSAGREYVEATFSGGQNYLVYAIIMAITFAAGVFIILQGVRLILAEIVPAFTGFSEKLVPNARPALDCPVVYPYAPNAVLIGFLFSFLGGLVGLFLLGQMKLVLILPGVVPHFFTGATAGVFGNATGGRRGAMIGAFANGLLITFLPVLLLPVLGAIGFANTTFSDADFGVIGILLGNLARYLSPMAITGLVVALFALLVAYNVLAKNKKANAEVQENSERMNVTEITQLARDIRVATLKSLNHLGFGHYGGSMSVVETLAVLYGAVMKIDPADPDWPERDYFVLSKGHAGPALYSTLAIKGYFPREELNTLNQNGTRLPSHPDRLKTRGVDATTGSLGQGISIAGGMALSHKLARRPNRVFCIVGDGELNEGQCWEAFQFIAHHRLNNLTVFIDWNKQQLDGELEEIINPFDLEGKFRAFGFDVVTVKGDDIAGLLAVVQPMPPADAQPRVVILDSIKGQGVPCLEQLTNSHHLRLTDGMKQTLNEAIHQLEVMHD
ncbi:PTS ascorbate transporter subunit IIC [Salmonella enterica]|nr:PTS ascorbate transporter subunit IIC [Salmonella enterica]